MNFVEFDHDGNHYKLTFKTIIPSFDPEYFQGISYTLQGLDEVGRTVAYSFQYGRIPLENAIISCNSGLFKIYKMEAEPTQPHTNTFNVRIYYPEPL